MTASVWEPWLGLDDLCCTYEIRNKKTSQRYVGSTIDARKRFSHHLKELRGSIHHCPHLQRAWTKYGEEAFSFRVLASYNSVEEAREAEQLLLSSGEKLYNASLCASGGDLLSYHPSKESIRARIVKTTKTRNEARSSEELKAIYGRRGEANGMYGGGYPYSEEARKAFEENGRRAGLSLQGRPKSEDHRRKMSINASKRIGEANPFFGRHHSEETKAKLRASSSGRTPTNCKQVKIEGIIYPTMKAASDTLGVSQATITYRVKSSSKRFAEYSFLSVEGEVAV